MDLKNIKCTYIVFVRIMFTWTRIYLKW